MYTVAVVDANLETGEELERLLSEAQFEVARFAGWREARASLAALRPHAVVLTDWRRLGGRGGERYLRRAAGGAPFVVVCDGGVTGWDDRFAAVLYYPVTSDQLSHAIRSAIARERALVSAFGFVLDRGSRTLTQGQRSASLTPIETAILSELMAARGQFVGSAELAERVWGTHARQDRRVLYTHMSWLRCKLERLLGEPGLIVSARLLGYRFAGPEARSGREP
ncbi:MAG: response regulator transcription factor [Anaerolineae bacterium]|nr:response regulator transcription factor [Anaerolineae bacterium]